MKGELHFEITALETKSPKPKATNNFCKVVAFCGPENLSSKHHEPTYNV